MTLHYEQVPCSRLVGEFGMPLYVYSQSALTEALENYQIAFAALSPLVRYAVKANGNLSIIKHFASLGSGFDIASGGELTRVLAAGGDAAKTVFSGVGKSEAEVEFAFHAGARCFNVESIPGIDRIQKVAERLSKAAYVSLRVNPGVDAKIHPYIFTDLKVNKFGIAYVDAFEAYRHVARQNHLKVIGIDCHIGSQLTDPGPLIEACGRILISVDRLADEGIVLEHLDLGGGVGIVYQDRTVPDLGTYAQAVQKLIGTRRLKLILGSGHSLVGNAGSLLTRVGFVKHGEEKNFVMVDAAMNDLTRPVLYDAYHHIEAVEPKNIPPLAADIVSPICETDDFLAKGRTLVCEAGDLLAVRSAGACGASMANNYNARNRAAEMLVNSNKSKLIHRREAWAQQMTNELDCL